MFWDVFPHYLLYGMTAEQFWNGDPYLAVAYRKLHKLKIQQRNEELWLNGLYTLDALSVALNNSFSKRKAKYIEQPFQIFPKTEDEKKREIEETRKKLVERLDALKKEFESNKNQGAT